MMTIVHTHLHTYIHTHRLCNTVHTACNIPNHIFTSTLCICYAPGIHLGCTWEGDGGVWGKPYVNVINFDHGLGRFCFHASMSAHCPLEEF